MNMLGKSVRALIGVALLVGGLLATAPAASASAGTSWGSGCGGPYTDTDQCNFIPPTATTVAGFAEVNTTTVVTPPIPMATFVISLHVIGPDGTQLLLCATHIPSPGAAACAGSHDIPASWAGQPMKCLVTATWVSGFMIGRPTGVYACQGV